MTGGAAAQPRPARRLAIVTGAASGMGLATVRLLLAQGTAVVGVDLAGAPPELAGTPQLDWVQGDVAAPETWARAQALALARDPGGADCLVTCAADIAIGPFLEIPPAEWRRLFEVNVVGVLHGMHALMPAMIARRDGAIAVVCSVNSLLTEDANSAYSASKAALLQLVRSAALEHARHGLRINAVCPGIVETPLLRRHFDALADPAAARAACVRRSPAGRLLAPEEIAETIGFLVGPGASGLSGAAVVVDGGLTTTYDYVLPDDGA